MPDLPLELGDSSAVETGPWHYGADYVSLYFKADREKLGALLPRPFDVGDGLCMAYVCEIVSVSDGRPQAVSEEPSRTQYGEAAFGIGCSFKGRKGIFFPVMWVDSEWSLLRGLVNGYSKRLADRIVMSRLHSLNPGLKPLGEGARLSGYSVKDGRTVLKVSAELERIGKPEDLVSFGVTFGIRRFPSTDESQEQVFEAVEVLKSNSRVSDVWVGKGGVDTEFDLGSMEVLRAAAYRSGFTISGSRVLSKL